jgi:hypothetical protein
MKCLVLAGMALAIFFTGCSSPKSVSNLEGKGTKQSFGYPYDVVWRAAVDAAQQGDLEVLTADKSRGYISARRTIQVHTFGENVGLWVRSLSPSSSEVEVVSRQSGPPVAWLKNWENEIIRAVSANVTRDAVGGTGAMTEIQRGSTAIVPETNERTTIVVPESQTEAELKLQTMREEQRRRELELQQEQNEQRRQEIRTEIDRLRAELRLQEERLSELEKEVK